MKVLSDVSTEVLLTSTIFVKKILQIKSTKIRQTEGNKKGWMKNALILIEYSVSRKK